MRKGDSCASGVPAQASHLQMDNTLQTAILASNLLVTSPLCFELQHVYLDVKPLGNLDEK